METGYEQTLSLFRESGYYYEQDGEAHSEYGQSFIDGEKTEFDVFEAELERIKLLENENGYFPMIDKKDKTMIVKLDDGRKAETIFKGWQETMIDSCLANIMGSVYVDDVKNPRSAAAVLGDFAFVTGDLCRELVDIKAYADRDFVIMVPQNEAWARLIEEVHGSRAKRVIRYAFLKEPDVFDEERLQEVVRSLSDEFTIKLVDEDVYNACKAESWSRDLVSQYADYELYHRLGLGVVILKDGVPVSGASSYSTYAGGIEIEIDTKKEYRRRGLAYTCGAALILACRRRNLYPSWDAQNTWSAALAQKLGYRFDCEYIAYEVQPE